MAFEPEELDLIIVFTAANKNNVKWVVGNSQWVYWKGCRGLIVFENGGEGIVQDQLTGQIKLKSGVELYIVGGQVKEG